MSANTEDVLTVIFSRIRELSNEQLNNSGASKLNFITEKKEAKKISKMDIKMEK
ncbi:hypothetical protein JJL45_11720 [Tamlana sp. s12]|uniref:hypothetical protein n=1 Tax=Tamlana sp. s12 TaxID=1630406 RepID=UPI00192B838C|nr:hypothetical protein [Tamlana sp. s12]QQY81583.1 hypothetical protein JJL45_11685 [Tamlana sp. s12]QQY81590.1 hypothetical protein JJL45_11720 [Tamlana sp. s12]